MLTAKSDAETKQPASPSKRKPLWKKLLKGLGVTVVALLLLIVIALTAAVWFLTPERLTPIIENLADDYLNGELRIERAELTFWSSFPNLRVEVDEAHLISHSLKGLDESQRAALPTDADSVVAIRHFEGSLNILEAMRGAVAINNVTVEGLRINLLQVTDSISNFDVILPTDEDTTRTEIPDITINHFAIIDSRPITYRSLPDSIDVAVYLRNINLEDKSSPQYQLSVDSRVQMPMLSQFALDSIQFALDGRVNWTASNPYNLALRDFEVKINQLKAIINTDLSFTNDLTVETLDVRVDNLVFSDLLCHAPKEVSPYLAPLQTDMGVNFNASLDQPFIVGDSLVVPSLTARLEIPPCAIKYDKIDFNRFETAITAKVTGYDLDRTVVDVEKFIIDGKAVDVNFSGRLSSLMNNPEVTGRFDGSIDFGQLPQALRDRLEADFSGRLAASTHFNLRAADFTKEGFHRLYFDGTMTLDDFSYMTRDSVTGAFAGHAELKFGSNERVTRGDSISRDSMLVVKLQADTARFYTEGVDLRASKIRAGLGTLNTREMLDTAVITPFGGGISVGRLLYLSLADTTVIALRDIRGLAQLSQQEGKATAPRLGLKLDAGRMAVRSTDFHGSLRGTHLDILAHLRSRRGLNRPSAATRMRGDSLSNSRRERRPTRGDGYISADELDSIGATTFDYDSDNSLRDLFLRWNIEANVTADRGLLRMSAINLRNTFRDLRLAFDTDSLALNNLDYKIGNSDFKFIGTISNIRGALNKRRPQPLRFNLSIESDTININEVVKALSASAKHDVDDVGDSIDEWAKGEAESIEHQNEAPDSVTGPLLIPVNVDAGLTIEARNVIFSDMILKDLNGKLLVYEGSVNLRDLRASTEMGSVNLNALYSAPTADKINFGMGLDLHNFYIEKLPKVVPALDSVMPMIKAFSGVVNAELALTSHINPDMYFDLTSVRASMRVDGDSLVVFDNAAFKKMAKWLMFKDKNRNMIDHLTVELAIKDGMLDIYPFMIDIDRYKLGVMGSNNFDLDLNYHVSVLKSPIPFKFGINLKGTPEHLKIRLGGAKVKPEMVAESSKIANDVRINLVEEMERVFRSGLQAARVGPLRINVPTQTQYMNEAEDAISHNDSILMIREGLIEAPDTVASPPVDNKKKKGKRK